MNVFRVISQDGYTRDNLTEKNREILSWLDTLLECVDLIKADYEDDESNDLMTRLYNQVATEVLEDTYDKVRSDIASIQITLIESQTDV